MMVTLLNIFCFRYTKWLPATSNKAIFAKKQVRKLAVLSSLSSPKTICCAKPNSICLDRSDLIQALCKSHGSPKDYFSGPGVKSWASKFIASSHLLESYMLLYHHKRAKHLLHIFRSIDPDRPDRSVKNTKQQDSHNIFDEHNSLEELSFLSQFAYILKQAGYEEVPQKTIKQCLKDRHKYENIELEVAYKKYVFVRFWIKGRREIDENNSTRVLHERVIVASRSKASNNMILKGFKNIPVDHYETLLPEAIVQIPWKRRWFLNVSLTATGAIAFFNVGMTVLTDFKLDFVWMLLLFSGFTAFRTMALYKSQRQKYILEWKKMLYYKSTANNAGLVLDVVNKAHEHSLKQALLVYGTGLRLTQTVTSVSEDEVTRAACEWLSSVNKYDVIRDDLLLGSSFSFLQRIGLVMLDKNEEDSEARYKFQLPDEATEKLKYLVTAIAAE